MAARSPEHRTYTPMGNSRSEDEEDFYIDMDDAISSGYYTPDAAKLQRYTHQDVFIYGNEKKGFLEDKIIQTDGDAKALGIGWTAQEQCVMYRRLRPSGKVDAVALTTNMPLQAAPIYGEIYRVTIPTLLHLDWHMSNHTSHKRVFVPIRVRRGEHFIMHGCWIYFGIHKHWQPKIGTELFKCEPQKSGFYSRSYYSFMKKYILNG